MDHVQSLLYSLLVFALYKDGYGAETLPGSFYSDPRIIGGRRTTIQEHPYQVFLKVKLKDVKGDFRCGGSIANKNCIITAAHCLTQLESVTVRAGSTSFSEGGIEYAVKTVTPHPKYSPQTRDYDIGVIKPKKTIEIDGKNSSRIEFPPKNCNLNIDSNLTVSGWGATNEEGDLPDFLREVDVDFVPKNECGRSYRDLTPRMICAGVPGGGKDSCSGDSGGPLVITGTKTQVGIVSYGQGCGRPDYPGVYSNLCDPDIQQWLKKEGCM